MSIPFHRTVASAQMLAETVAAVGFEETIKSIVPLLGPLAAVSVTRQPCQPHIILAIYLS